jgi:hypothetical protein
MRKLIFLAFVALAAVPAALADGSPSPSQQASASCKQQRTSMGASAFTQLYGGGANAYGRCVSKVAGTLSSDTANAAKQCKAEQSDATFAASHAGKTFDQVYGTGKNGHDAFGKCVSQKAQALAQKQQDATVSAAQSCKSERASIGAKAFAEKYGNRANAFGKCVAKTAHAQP